MNHYTFKLFAKTEQISHLRLFDQEGRLLSERVLVAAEVQAFAQEVKAGYQRDDLSQPRLIELGRRLYEWLDGPTERWLAVTREGAQGLAVHVDVAEQLCHLPWELLFAEGSFLCHNASRPFTPVRLFPNQPRPQPRENRPLRILFMACSAEDVQPVLSYEHEEIAILEATRKHQIELVVEESGSPGGLLERVGDYGADHGQSYFDVFHLTGHADVRDGQPIFWMENDLGYGLDVTAQQLAQAFAGNWPRLVFLSGCRTGEAVNQGALPSLCEALVRAGAPAVLGWALPVLDQDASHAAATLYGHLAAGKRLDEAVARARQQLIEEHSSDWHLLRLYADETELSELVTPPKHAGRKRYQVRPSETVFLDAKRDAYGQQQEAGKVEVCARAEFVGRRRPLQRCLRVLKSQDGDANYAEGVLLHGMGGLGKSSVAARLCERLHDHQRLVLVAALDEAALLRTLGDRLDSVEARQILNEPLPLKNRLRRLLESAAFDRPALFVLDDFEHNLEPIVSGGYQLKPEPLAILTALLAAIRETASASRVIVTSRYQFPLPGSARLYEEGLESLRDAELAKKLRQLDEKHRLTKEQAEPRARARELGAGNPRLLEWLYRVIADDATDHEAIFTAIEDKAAQFREATLLRELLDRQTAECRRLIALLSVYHLPVAHAAVAAVADGLDFAPHLARAVALGLIEEGVLADPQTYAITHRYFVSDILAPLLANEITAAERTAACGRAAQHLYQHWWVERERASLEEGLEVHRLALLAAEQEIAIAICFPIATHWISNAQYREAVILCSDTLSLGDDHRLLLNLARAEQVLGDTTNARRHYEQALAQCPDDMTSAEVIKERSGILYNYAALLTQQGEVERAMKLYEESGNLDEQISDVKGKAATLANMAGVVAQQGDVQRALQLWQQSLTLKEQIGDIKGKATTLANMAGVIAQQGDVQRALQLWQQSLALLEQIGDVRGKAATLSMMAGVIAQQGDVQRALQLWQQSLALLEQIGDVKSKAATLHNMAGVIAQQGDVQRALQLWQQSLALEEQIGDVQGKAATLSMMADVIAQQGDVQRALQLWQQSLALLEQIGDVKSKAATLHNMAGVIAQQGDVQRALQLWQQSLELEEQIGDVRGKAATLANMARLAGQQGDAQQERKLNLEAARALAASRAWLDLVTVLRNLGAGDDEEAGAFLAQASWLTLRLEVPVKASLNLSAAVLQKVGVESDLAPLLATATLFFVQIRGQQHPEQEQLQQYAFNMLAACAAARQIDPEQFGDWMARAGLNDPARFLPALSAALEAMVGADGWLFDRATVQG